VGDMVEDIYYGIDEAIIYNKYSNTVTWKTNSSSTTSAIYENYYWADSASITAVQDKWVKKIVANYYDSTAGYKLCTDPYLSTGNSYTTNDNTWSMWVDARHVPTPSERLRGIIQARQAPFIIGTRKPIKLTVDPKEVRARETLLRVLGEEKYRGFLRNGFVSVRGKSGKVYQIYPGHDITKVYQNGQMVERLCVVLTGSFPPTDALIMRFLLILNDEEEFRSFAIKHSVSPRRRDQKVVDMRPLPEIYKSLLAA